MKQKKVINSLFHKLQHEDTGQYFCNYQEVMQWPKGLFIRMLKAGFLVKANQAKGLICTECHKECYKMIERESDGSLFIYCNDPDEISSYIPIQPTALQQWSISQKSIANFIASFLDPYNQDKLALWADVGMFVHINRKPAHVRLVWERQLCFQVNKETPYPLTSLLVWHKDGFRLDMESINAIGETAISKHSSVDIPDIEKQCAEWIKTLPEIPIPVKKELQEKAKTHFKALTGDDLTGRAFDRAWKKAAPKSWKNAGPKTNRITAPNNQDS